MKAVKDALKARADKAKKSKDAKIAAEATKEHKKQLRLKNAHAHVAQKLSVRESEEQRRADAPPVRESEVKRKVEAEDIATEEATRKKKAKAELAAARKKEALERHKAEEHRNRQRHKRYTVLFFCNVIDIAMGAGLVWYGTVFGLQQNKLPTLWYGCGGLGTMLLLIGLTSFLLLRPSNWIICCAKWSVAGENDWRVWGCLKASAYMTILVSLTAIIFGGSIAVNDTLRLEISNLEKGSKIATPTNAVLMCFGIAALQGLHFWAAQHILGRNKILAKKGRERWRLFLSAPAPFMSKLCMLLPCCARYSAAYSHTRMLLPCSRSTQHLACSDLLLSFCALGSKPPARVIDRSAWPRSKIGWGFSTSPTQTRRMSTACMGARWAPLTR
jgi:hypothetical protein